MKHNNIIISIGSNLNGHMNTSKTVSNTFLEVFICPFKFEPIDIIMLLCFMKINNLSYVYLI